MGMMSKKRAQPRIIKKRKNKNKKMKKRVAPNGMADTAKWSGEKTAKQNYEGLGIVMNNKPSMRQSKQGKALMTEARIRINKKHYEQQGMIDEDLEEMKATQETANNADLTKLFPEIKSRNEAVIKPTVRRIKNDEK